MIPQTVEKHLKDLISKQPDVSIGSLHVEAVGGGSINDTYRLSLDDQPTFFLKINQVRKIPALFEKEKTGLEFLSRQHIIRTPAVIHCGTVDNYQVLLLEWIGSGIRSEEFWKRFGEQLAQLHHIKNDQFGFAGDNYMGSLPQENKFTPVWTSFFIHHRLQPQINLAVDRNLLQKKQLDQFESLFKQLDSVFNVEEPALLHGDLWSGNFICDSQSLPVLIDPAVYFGHRSMDLAMTTLFSGFDKVFYESYHYHYPFPDNYREQWEICNLYPLLIHLNLFGSGYLTEINSILSRFA